MASKMTNGDKWELIDNDINSQNYGKKFKFDFSYIESDSIKNLIKTYVWKNYKEENNVLDKLYLDVIRFKLFNNFAISNNINSFNILKNKDIDMFVSYLKTILNTKTNKGYSYNYQRMYLETLKAILRWRQLYMPNEVPKAKIFTGNEYVGVNRKLKIDFIPDEVLEQINIALVNEENHYIKY